MARLPSRVVLRLGTSVRRLLVGATKWLLLATVLVLLIGNASFATLRDVAYRSGDPGSPMCRGADAPSTALAAHGNDEQRLIGETDAGEDWQDRLTCAVQTHAIPRDKQGAGGLPPLRYHLAFLEYREDGSPQAMARFRDDAPDQPQVYSQLKVLLDHLHAHKANYVLVFVHGWRHDASIGDGNVADARIYAASVARFLADRCAAFGASGQPPPMPYCDMEVTAVYVGWRGARVDENKLTRWFGTLGSWLGRIAMLPTLFDRKPVSEQVGPAVATALHAISDSLPRAPNRMIVFGHSLGGNMLMTAMEDGLVKQVVRHDPATLVAPPFGDLVVLINPASEAAHWTAIQRAVWQRIAYRQSDVTSASSLVAGHRFFPVNQKPILVSVTAAHTFPPGGVRAEDCFGLRANPEAAKLLDESRSLVDHGVEYDWATYDLFPAFKGDLRPVAGTLARWAARVAGDADPDDACSSRRGPMWREWAMRPVVWLSEFLENAPFMSTDREQTHTIGNLDPPRAAYGTLQQYLLPAKLIGTTHELIGRDATGTETPVDYPDLGASPRVTCPIATNWLIRARTADQAKPFGVDWRSDQLAPGDAAPPPAIFIHGFRNGGMAPITRANDPFWNMRAFDNTLARHDGYLLPSFICAMNQLVMDDIAVAAPAPPAPTAPAPSGSAPSAEAPGSVLP